MDALVDLPLFPLQAVLVPGMGLPLHVFEPRYQQLLRDCRAADQRFGVVLIREGSEVGDTAVPHDVGTVAEIVSATALPDGTFKVETAGRERFRIRRLWHDRPYLWCHAELLADPLGDADETRACDVQVRALTAEYVDAFYSMIGQADQRRRVSLPDDSLALSYAVAMLLHVAAHETQTLLEAATAAARLSLEVDVLHREVAILRLMSRGQTQRDGPGRPRPSLN